MNFAGLVPGDTPFKNMTEDPPPGVGPYMITESVPNRQFVMEKNPDFADARDPRHPDRLHRHDHDRDHQEPRPADPGRARQQARLHAGPAVGRPQAEVNALVGPDGSEAQRYEEFATSSTYYFFMNNEVAAVRRPGGPRGGQLRHRQAGAGAPVRGRAGTRAARSCRRACRATTRRSTRPSARTATRTQPPDIEKAQAADRGGRRRRRQGHGLGQQRRPDRQGHPGVRRQLNKIGLRRDAEDPRRRRLLPDDRQRRRRRPRPGSPTGSRTSRTRSTSTSWLTGRRSSRPTTRTSATSTTRRSTTRSTGSERGDRTSQSVAERLGGAGPLPGQPPKAYIAPYGHRKLATFVSERMDFDVGGLPPGLLQRLHELGVEGGRVDESTEGGAPIGAPLLSA